MLVKSAYLLLHTSTSPGRDRSLLPRSHFGNVFTTIIATTALSHEACISLPAAIYRDRMATGKRQASINPHKPRVSEPSQSNGQTIPPFPLRSQLG